MTAPTWSYDATALATSKKDQVRRLIGDVLTNDQQIYDEEIVFALTQKPSIYGAGADCCRYIAAQYSRKADLVQGELKTNYSRLATAYEERAVTLDRYNLIRGAGVPYAGAMSQADKQSQVNNPDRVPPQFNLGMDDNQIPVTEAGNVVPGSPGSQASGEPE